MRHSTSYHRKVSLCDSTLYQVEVGPVKKRSDSVERSTRKEEWIRIEGPFLNQRCYVKVKSNIASEGRVFALYDSTSNTYHNN